MHGMYNARSKVRTLDYDQYSMIVDANAINETMNVHLIHDDRMKQMPRHQSKRKKLATDNYIIFIFEFAAIR